MEGSRKPKAARKKAQILHLYHIMEITKPIDIQNALQAGSSLQDKDSFLC